MQPKKSRIIERNKKIIEDYPKMTPKAMEEKYHLQFEYIKYIATSHRRNDLKEKIKCEKKEVTSCGLYAERDLAIKQFLSGIENKPYKISPCPDNIRTNKGYSKRRI
jgi:hypothetical protein